MLYAKVILVAAVLFAGLGLGSAVGAEGGLKTGEGGLKPGDVLSKDNWKQAEGLLPPEVLKHYQSGGYANHIVDWPLGQYKWDKEFLEATELNSTRLALSESGTVVDKNSGEQPPFVLGYPFPKIDKNDPQAGAKILWNYFYGFWQHGSLHTNSQVNWVGPAGLERMSIQDVSFMYYDGQFERYRAPNPQNFSMQQLVNTMYPADLQGTTALSWRYRDPQKRDSNWVYVPALRRVRAVSPANRSDGFLGSDMSQDDGPFFDGKPEDFTWKLVGETEQLRIVDPLSLQGKAGTEWLAAGGWRARWPKGPIVGYEDPDWKGLGWAPRAPALAKRPMWIVEGTPKDKYYLYGRLELFIDKETFQGAWNRKFSWSGELLNTMQVIAYNHVLMTRGDGGQEYIQGSNMSFQCAENIKANRATIAGLMAPGADPVTDSRVKFAPGFFDMQSLQRFGK
jgi:hypothetical protein